MSWKTRVAGLESDQKILSDLMEVIRTGDPSQVAGLIRQIQGNASIEELANSLAAALSRRSSVEESDVRTEASTRGESSYATPSAPPRAFQASPNVISVPAKPWTTVTDDDELVSHLISLWFTWRHWCYPFVNREEFVKAMQSGNKDSRICTPALVNMILADACVSFLVSHQKTHPLIVLLIEISSSTTIRQTSRPTPSLPKSLCGNCFTMRPDDTHKRLSPRDLYHRFNFWRSRGCSKSSSVGFRAAGGL